MKKSYPRVQEDLIFGQVEKAPESNRELALEVIRRRLVRVLESYPWVRFWVR